VRQDIRHQAPHQQILLLEGLQILLVALATDL